MNWKTIKQLASYQKDGKKAGLLEELVENYFQEFPDLILALKENILNKNSAMLERVAHKLKGGSYTIGAQSLGDVFNKLEIKGRSGDFSEITSLLEEVNKISQQTEMELRDFIKQQQK
jgi:HPt (histidine-containing phosphotransfer) domain-containing protein